MKRTTKIVLTFFSVSVGLFIAVLAFFTYAIASYFSPTSPEDAVESLKTYVEYDFGNSYKIIQFESRNNHPDRLLSYVLQFNTAESNWIDFVEFCKNQRDTIIVDFDDKYKIETDIKYDCNGMIKRFNVEDTTISYPVFSKELKIWYNSGILEFNQGYY